MHSKTRQRRVLSLALRGNLRKWYSVYIRIRFRPLGLRLPTGNGKITKVYGNNGWGYCKLSFRPIQGAASVSMHSS